MTRMGIRGGAAVVCAITAMGIATGAQARVPAHSQRSPAARTVAAHSAPATLHVANTVGGALIVNSRGKTVFMFTKNARRLDRCAAIHGCLTDWPAVTTTSRAIAGTGLKQSLIGTIPLTGKLRQVTYDGYPLHTYKFDVGKGSTMAIGNRQFGGLWFGLKPNGDVVR